MQRIFNKYFRSYFRSFVPLRVFNTYKVFDNDDISQNVDLIYRDEKNKVAHVKYSLYTGEIRYEHQYQNKKIGIVREMRENGCDQVYCISYRNHPFRIREDWKKEFKFNENDTVLFYKPLSVPLSIVHKKL